MSDCGCEIKHPAPMPHPPSRIIYCPKHAAVDDLLAALRHHCGEQEEILYGLVSEYAERLEQEGKPDNAVGWRFHGQRIWRNLQAARAALAKAGTP